MSKRIIYSRGDGQLCLIAPAPGYAIEQVLLHDMPEGATDIAVVDETLIPADKTFREAWVRGTTKPVEVDMNKARALHMSRIRAVRDRQLDRLDREVNRALALHDVPRMAALEADRQSLRDIPQSLDLSQATTPERLKALWPAGLPRE